MAHHAFVAMPFDIKKDNQASRSDFNRLYAELMTPGLKSFGQMRKREPSTFPPIWEMVDLSPCS
jgi:hypothetical protein